MDSRSVVALTAVTLSLTLCGCASETPTKSNDEVVAPSSGAGPTGADETLPLLDAMPEDGLPPHFDEQRGFAAYRLRDGRRVAFITAPTRDASASEADSDLVVARGALTSVEASPVIDTWVRRSTDGTTDFGKSCELRVNNILLASQTELDFSILRFPIPAAVRCATITSAKLFMKTAQNPTAGLSLVVFPHRVDGPWTPGKSGLALCDSCSVSGGDGVPFALPPYTLVNAPTTVNARCATFSWELKSLVAGPTGWCSAPAQNRGVLMTARNGSSIIISFHSMESPVPADRPRLVITY